MLTHAQVQDLDQAVALRGDSSRDDAASISDAALIAAIARGDQKAMRRLYERHSLRVYRFARRLLHDRSAAEDLVRLRERRLPRQGRDASLGILRWQRQRQGLQCHQ